MELVALRAINILYNVKLSLLQKRLQEAFYCFALRLMLIIEIDANESKIIFLQVGYERSSLIKQNGNI